MTICRFLQVSLLTLIVAVLTTGPVHAAFGFGSDDSKGKSGLDMNHGYDVNTVTTVGGKVVATPYIIEKEYVAIDIQNDAGTFTICVGPASYWKSNGVPVAINDEIVVKGSMAQGQDGKKYVIAQKITDTTTGGNLEIRSESGIATWSGRSTGGRTGRMNSGSMGTRGNTIMRGGGMMRR